MSNDIRVALPKGRLGQSVYEAFVTAGFAEALNPDDSRKLIFRHEPSGMQFFWVKPSDVAMYVERGAADVGVVGKDILLENKPDVYELLDLGIGKCAFAVAGPAEFEDDPDRELRVATKFDQTARDYFEQVGRDIDIIHLSGSVELAPIVGLSDVILDIVETGSTLRENGLVVLKRIHEISARFIANKASYSFNHHKIQELVAAMEPLAKEAR